jgi:chloramphenicol 3-O phosphotransferase
MLREVAFYSLKERYLAGRLCYQHTRQQSELQSNMSYIIFLNGTSSAGKSTISKELQAVMNIPLWHFASDQLVEAGMLPKRENDGGPFDWRFDRPKFFDAFHACIRSIADAGNNIIVDHVIESQKWFEYLASSLIKHDVFFVGIHCPMEVFRKREEKRGDRYIGEAEYHLRHVHSYGKYDF